MLLTECEREFLAAFIHEATTDPFQGPATEELHQRNIYYADLSHLLAAYYREETGVQEGFGGRSNPAAPACPWQDRDSAIRRDHEVGQELQRLAKSIAS
jgi:hypothetical protein